MIIDKKNIFQIKVKLLLAVWAVTALFTLLFTAIQIYIEYNTEVDRAYSQYDIVEKSFLPLLRENLWAFNEVGLKEGVKSISLLHGVKYVELNVPGYYDLKSNKHSVKSNLYFSEYSIAKKNMHLGKLYIELDIKSINKHFFKKALYIFLGQCVKTFIVSAILLWIFQFFVTRHLISIYKFFKGPRDLHQAPKKLILDRLNSKPDELDLIISSINEMHESVYEYYHQLEEINLDQSREIDNKTKELRKTNRALEQRVREINKVQTLLEAQQKLASIGIVAAGIAHEIRNPLNMIISYNHVLQDTLKELSLDDNIKQQLVSHCELIKKQSHKVESIISNILQMSRSKKIEDKKPINLFELLNNTLDRIKDNKAIEIPEDLEIITEASAGTLYITAHKESFSRVLMNLCTNSLYSIARKKQRLENYKPQLFVKLEEVDDKHVFTFKDNGEGMSDEVKRSLFLEFYTTKPPNVGVGLGMNLIYNIVDMHGGHIGVDSIEGEYAEVTIILPIL